MRSLTDIQEAFVRQYVTDDRIIGVRISRLDDGHFVLDVELAAESYGPELPSEFGGLGVRPRLGQRAVLAFEYS